MVKSFVWVILFALVAPMVRSQQTVTWYEYYTAGGRQEGLVPANPNEFTLNGKAFRIVSGSIHYFRVHPAYWRDRLKKLRALGANTVETYLPWNLHEPRRGEYDFGEGQNDMSAFLDLRTFVQMAREEDLFVILRPGAFICAEWDFGGMPSWLLGDPNMKVRTTYRGYLDASDKYYDQVIRRVADLQFTRGDGPIIAFQIENEYGAFGSDTAYLTHLRDKMIEFGVTEMFFTSDNGNFENGRIPGTLTTANFNQGGDAKFDQLRRLQPEFPLMVTEFWSGWFDHWGQGFHDSGFTTEDFTNTLRSVFLRNASANFYMFHGGTTFGFLNGANEKATSPFYEPTINSYDYGAPLSEAGDYTAKYDAAKQIFAEFQWIPNLAMPAQPPQTIKTAYPAIQATQHLTLNQLLAQVPSSLIVQSPTPLAMEDLPINSNSGQSYGYINYRKVIPLNGQHTVKTNGRVQHLAVFMLDAQRLTEAWDDNNKLTTFGYYGAVDATLQFSATGGPGDHTMDFLVENMGRVNYGGPGAFVTKSGLTGGPVELDGQEITDWTIYSLEFTKTWVNSLTNWVNTPSPGGSVVTPTMTRSVLTISGQPTDTFIVTSNFGTGNRGAVFVNGFNIGRFSVIGPTKTMFIPAPLLRSGVNNIDVFALFTPVTQITFTDTPVLG